MTDSLIQPRTLKGFRDYLPATMVRREWMMQTARQVYRRFGFVPIDTPALEYFEILTGKGSEETDKQMYHFEHGRHHVGMRFDLTIPLARFVAQHHVTVGLPFKRYQIAPVWRGENTQAGRYREFSQCDFDTIGTESVLADIETICVAHDLLAALKLPAFEICINSRKVLKGLLQSIDAGDRATVVLRALDKFDKLGEDVVAKELEEVAQLVPPQIDAVLAMARITGSNTEIIDQLQKLLGSQADAAEGIDRLKLICDALSDMNVAPERVQINLRIARGLDYYTGIVFETILSDLPEIGSVCSGGRYDNLAGKYTKQYLPGIGGSLGLDRLLAALEQLGSGDETAASRTIFIPYFDADRLKDYLQIATAVRQAGFDVELYPEPKKLGQQLKYADFRGFPIALIAGSQELDAGKCQIKDLRNKTTMDASWRPSVKPLTEAIATTLKPVAIDL